MRPSLLLVLLLSPFGPTSCSLRWSRREPPATLSDVAEAAVECDSLDNKQVRWTVASIVTGALSGGSGLTTAVIPGDTNKYVMGGISLGLTISSAVSTFMATHYVQKFCRRCANIVPLTK